MANVSALLDALGKQPRVRLGHHPTPIEKLANLSSDLGILLSVKRDDCNGLAFGGNKVRQLEYYLGPAIEQKADTVLVTGAVQSNFVRTTAAAAAKLGLASEVQLEERVANPDELYRKSGNVLIDELLGATVSYFPEGENEVAADAALDTRAAELVQKGRRPYVIHLGLDHAPTGALGYAQAAAEIVDQLGPELPEAIVLASGSGLTHAGLLAGVRICGWKVPIIGICVRRNAGLQFSRVKRRSDEVCAMLGFENLIADSDVIVRDDVLAPGYGTMNEAVVHAIDAAARREALLLDPVYTGRTLAGIIACLEKGVIGRGSRVLMIHTGGNTGLFAYQNELAKSFPRVSPIGQ